MTSRLTVIIPAHNEEASIGRTLAAMGAGTTLDARVVVVCSDCSDRTAEMTRAACPSALVVEESTPGKCLAINAGLAHADDGPIIVVDADIEISAGSIAALAATLAQPGVEAVSPAVRFDLAEVSAPVRAYYRNFLSHAYLASGTGGAGVYGISREGLRRIGRFPAVVSDDGFVRRVIPADRQQRVVGSPDRPVYALVRPPRTLLELLHSEARWRRGDREVRRLLPGRSDPALLIPAEVSAAGGALKDRLCYVGIKLLGRAYSYLGDLHPDRTWRKDPSSRLPPSAGR